MKKLLYLLLCVSVVFSFAACTEIQEYAPDVYEPTSETESAQKKSSYEDAIRLMMKTFSADFTAEELENMFPEAAWVCLEEERKQSREEIFEDFSGKMKEIWAADKEEFGENAAVKYEILERNDYEGSAYEELKKKLEERCGIPQDAFGICYEVKLKKAIVGKLKEEITPKSYHVLEIDGNWYVAEVLTDML